MCVSKVSWLIEGFLFSSHLSSFGRGVYNAVKGTNA